MGGGNLHGEQIEVNAFWGEGRAGSMTAVLTLRVEGQEGTCREMAHFSVMHFVCYSHTGTTAP